MALGTAGIVSIVELIVYIPAFIAAVMVCSRHGVHRSSGWVYTVILCVVRIAGAVCQVLSYSNQSEGLLKATVIIDSIGLSPLLLATLGVISRFVDWINIRGYQVLGIKQFRLVQLLITLGLILSIAGGSSSSATGNGQVTVSTTARVGIILYVVAFAGLTYFLLVASSYRSSVPPQERRSPVAVAIAWPLILVRLVYSALAVFLHDSNFSVLDGNITLHVCLAVLEEFLVVIDYLILGFSLRKLEPEQQGELANRAWKDRKDRRNQRA